VQSCKHADEFRFCPFLTTFSRYPGCIVYAFNRKSRKKKRTLKKRDFFVPVLLSIFMQYPLMHSPQMPDGGPLKNA
jgi:hypothetical protein